MPHIHGGKDVDRDCEPLRRFKDNGESHAKHVQADGSLPIRCLPISTPDRTEDGSKVEAERLPQLPPDELPILFKIKIGQP